MICSITLLFIAYLVIHSSISWPKLILSVYTKLRVQGIYPEKITFISPVISEIYLMMLLIIADVVIHPPIS